MKKFALGIALVTMVAFSACAQRFCPESDFEVEPVEGGGSVRIVRYVGNSFDVRIPPRIGNLPVAHIGEDAFAGGHWDVRWVIGHQLATVTIPHSVTIIDEGAFALNQLTNIIIPNSVTTIGDWAFYANQLNSVTIGNGVKNIGDGAFARNQLKSVIIGDSVTCIGNNAFANNLLTSVIIPNGVNSIGGESFAGNQLTSIAIPDSVTTIGPWAFYANLLNNVIIGCGVTSIEDGAFGNNQISNIVLPNSITNIGPWAFDEMVVVIRAGIKESNLIGRWELSEVNVSRDLVANHLEFFDDRTGIMSLGAWSEGFTWRIDDGRLIFTSPVGMVQFFSIVELSRTTLTYEGVAPMLGNIRATFTRRR